MGRGHDEPLVDYGSAAEDGVVVPWTDEGHLPRILILLCILPTDDELEASMASMEAATGGTLKPALAICDAK